MNVFNLCLLQGKAYIAVLCLLPTDNRHCCFLFIYIENGYKLNIQNLSDSICFI